MQKTIIIIMISVFGLISQMSLATTINNGLTPAQNCQNLQCVRKNIDTVDKAIVKLLGERLRNVARAGELKKHTKSVHDQARENLILKTVSQQAQQAGYPGSIAKAVFKTILLQANVYEKQFHHYN